MHKGLYTGEREWQRELNRKGDLLSSGAYYVAGAVIVMLHELWDFITESLLPEDSVFSQQRG